MKNTLLCSAALLLCAGQAMAVSGVYVAPKLGWSSGQLSDVHLDYKYSNTNAQNAGFAVGKRSDNSNVFAMGAAVGYQYGKWLVPMRMETEYLYRNHYDYKTGGCVNGNCIPASQANTMSTIDTQTLLANFYLDVPVVDMFSLFMGVGAGAAMSEAETSIHAEGIGTSGSMNDYSFSWMGTAGMTFSPLKWLSFDLSYRYSDLGDVTMRVNNQLQTGGGGGGGGGSNLQLKSDDFTAQEVLLGIRMLIPNMHSKPKKQEMQHQYLDK